MCLPLLQYWVPALCVPSLSRSWSPVPSLHKYCTRSVSAPPTILSPSPVRPFSISIAVSHPYINTVPEVCLPLLQYWVPALCVPSLSRSWSPVPSLHKYCTRSVSAPPTILSPSPVRPFSISIVVPSLHKYCTRSVSAPPTILSPSPVRPFSISIMVPRPLPT